MTSPLSSWALACRIYGDYWMLRCLEDPEPAPIEQIEDLVEDVVEMIYTSREIIID